MNTARKPNAMLIELVIVILFFSISAGIILQLFVAAGSKSSQNSTDNMALLIAEDVAERFAASSQDMDAFFTEAGWTATDGGYEMAQETADGRSLRLVASAEAPNAREAGALDSFALALYDGGREVVTLPVARYLPKEVAP